MDRTDVRGKVRQRVAGLFCRHAWQMDGQHNGWVDGRYVFNGYDLKCSRCGRVKWVHDDVS